MKKGTVKLMRRDVGSTEHCSVPLCNSSARFTTLSFHRFPEDAEVRAKWVVNIRRDNFTVTPRCYVCSRHFMKEDVIETPGGLHRVRKGALPVLFEWNTYEVRQRVSVWQRRERPCPDQTVMDGDADAAAAETVMEEPCDHDYCTAPKPAAVDMALSERDEMKDELSQLKKQVEDLSLKCKFGLHRFEGSDSQIRNFTRFATYDHLVAFWELIEPSTANMIRVTRARRAQQRNEEIFIPCTYSRHALIPVDEFFLFLMYLALGSTEVDLADRFGIHPSTVSRIITTWTYYLYCLLGSLKIWMSQEEVEAVLPREFRESKYADTQVIIDCTELRCQQPESLSLQSEMFSSYKSHSTLKGLIGMAPHGAVTFISDLYAGSVSDKELFKQSGLQDLLTENMAVMADKGFLIVDCIPGPLYRPPFLSKQSQMPAADVNKTQEIAHLRVHVERIIGRIKLCKLFQSDIPVSLMGSINSLWAVACLLSNYQYGPLVKAWAQQ